MSNEKIKWPGHAKCAVMISYDVDGETLFTEGPGNADWYWPRSVAYGRYGPNRGVWHILDMLGRNDLRATFFVPGRIAERYPDMVREIDKAGHELGCHGYDHELFSEYSLEEQRNIVLRAQDMISGLTGKKFKGFRTPSGDPTKETAGLLHELGFAYSSSMRGDDRPYRTVLEGRPSDFIEIPAKWELDDYPQFAYDFYPPMPLSHDRIAGYKQVLENWRCEFDGYYRYGLCFVIMLHPQISGLPGRVLLTEKLIRHIKFRPDVWFATGSEIAEWWRENY